MFFEFMKNDIEAEANEFYTINLLTSEKVPDDCSCLIITTLKEDLTPMERDKIIVRTSIIGILTNIVLVIFKITVGLFVSSIAIILDGVNNLSDVLSSVVTIIGTKLARKAPDKEHPYGHGRIEYFASVIIAVIILLAGVMALKASIEKIINPLDADYGLLSMIIIVVAIFTKYILGSYVKKKGYEVNSSSLVASGTDAHMDVILSLSKI